jgi:hypothetical protein
MPINYSYPHFDVQVMGTSCSRPNKKTAAHNVAVVVTATLAVTHINKPEAT